MGANFDDSDAKKKRSRLAATCLMFIFKKFSTADDQRTQEPGNSQLNFHLSGAHNFAVIIKGDAILLRIVILKVNI